MRLFYLLLLNSIVFCSCVSNWVKDDVTDPADEMIIYDFANWYVKTWQIDMLCEESKYMIFESAKKTKEKFEERLKDTFTSAESRYIMKQYDLMANFHWNQNRLNNVKLISESAYRARFGDYKMWETEGKKRIFAFSRPLLSSDKKTMVVYIEKNCPDCSYGGFQAFSKTGEGWKKIDSNFSSWIE